MNYYSDIDPFCCAVLQAHIDAGRLPAGKVYPRDIRDIRPDDLVGYDQVHLFAGIGGFPLGLRLAGWPDDWRIWTGGFPCQDISCAGQGKGLVHGTRSRLWWEFYRLIASCRPKLLIVENVPALRTRGVDLVIASLEGIGYAVEDPVVVGAWAVGAPHKRDRVWIVGRLEDSARDGEHGTAGEWPVGQRTRQAGERELAHRDGWRPQDEREQEERDDPDGRGAAAVAHAEPHGRGAGTRESGDEGGTRERGSEPAGSGELAHPASRGLRADGGALGDAGHADECDQAVDHAQREGLEGHRRDAGQPELAEPRHDSFPGWPARPGQPQHDWEAPRIVRLADPELSCAARLGADGWRGDLSAMGHSEGGRGVEAGATEQPVGSPTDGLPGGLVRPADRDALAVARFANKQALKAARFANKQALKAAGNSVVPQVVAAVATAVMDAF